MPTDSVALLERELAVALPEQYRSALLAYPFAAGSVGEEMLVADVEWLRERNRANDRAFAPGSSGRQSLPGLAEGLLLIGIDGGELQYYLDLNSSANAVMEYSLETRRLSEFAASFPQYLARIRQIDARIGAEEALGEESARAIPGWRHSLRSYLPAAIALLIVFVIVPLVAFGIRSLYRWMIE